jgi:hypothetical protein
MRASYGTPALSNSTTGGAPDAAGGTGAPTGDPTADVEDVSGVGTLGALVGAGGTKGTTLLGGGGTIAVAVSGDKFGAAVGTEVEAGTVGAAACVPVGTFVAPSIASRNVA